MEQKTEIVGYFNEGSLSSFAGTFGPDGKLKLLEADCSLFISPASESHV